MKSLPGSFQMEDAGFPYSKILGVVCSFVTVALECRLCPSKVLELSRFHKMGRGFLLLDLCGLCHQASGPQIG